MTVARELLSLLEHLALRMKLPKVRALHLPPPDKAGTKDGEFCALELDDGSMGLGYVLLDDTLMQLLNGPQRSELVGADALAVARRYAESNGLWRTLGYTAVCALTRSFFDRTGFVPDASADSIGMMNPQPGDHIGMVGHFNPLIPRIIQSGARLTVAELKAELAGDWDGYRVTLDVAELADCNKVLSTSSVMLNDTLDLILQHSRNARYFALVGPGAGCLPDPLFERGVTLLGGTWITDREGFRASLVDGESWSRYAHKYALLRQDYPGFDALLGRL
jgi:uncharacterized protein (DUF4213/DUF364 family)